MSVILHDGEGLPQNGTTGQILTKIDTGAAWQDKPTYTASEVGAAVATHTHSATDITSGILGLAQGGTGKNTAPLGLYALINGSTALASTGIATGDYFAVGDVSAATGKKITLANLKTALGVDSSSGGVVVGSYAGNQSRPATSSSTQQTTQTITLGFQPKFVWVGRLDGNPNITPWYEQESFVYPSSERSYNYEKIAFSAYAIPNYPYVARQGKYIYSSSSGDDAKVNVLEITSTGFNVGNARYIDEDTTMSPEENSDYQASLNRSGYTYFYLAVK